MSGANEMFECVCQFFRQQSDALQSVMQNMGSMNTISDIGGDDGLNLSNMTPQGGLLNEISPMQFFMFLLLMMWGYMFIFSQQAKAKNEKPAPGGGYNGEGEGSGSSSSGSPPPPPAVS